MVTTISAFSIISAMESDKDVQIPDHLPFLVGKFALDCCLSSLPLVMATVNLIGSMSDKHISLRNEKQAKELLEKLSQKIEDLDKRHILLKEKLRDNPAYQEMAHKKLSSLTALDTDEDINLSSCLIALCGLLMGTDARDKYLLRALAEISTDELKLFFLLADKRRLIESKIKAFTDDERRDAQSKVNVDIEVGIEFLNQGEQLLKMNNFAHLLSRLHNFGMIEMPNSGGFSDYSKPAKIYPPKLTSLGEYLEALFDKIEN